MANTIDFNVSTNATTVLNQTANAAENTAKGFTSAKAELRALNNQLLTMDQTSDAFKKASARAAELKDNISDLGAEINANAGNAFEGLSNNVGLFGSRLMSLDLKGAGQALSGMGAAVGKIDFKTLKDEIGGLIKGFGNLTKAILANPYLLLAAAVIAIIANFDKLIKLFPSVEKGLTGINEIERDSLALSKAKADASQKTYENIDKQTNILKLQGKSEKEILQIKLKALETAIADRKAQLLITEKQAITQVETAKRNREILEGIIKFLTMPIQLLLSAVDGIAGMLGQESKLAEGFTDLAAGLLIDPDEMEAELAKTIQENKDAIGTMENDYAGLQLSIKDIDKKAADDKNKLNAQSKAEQDKINEEAKKKAIADAVSVDQRLRQVEKDRADSRKTAIQKEEDDILAIQKTELEKYVLAYGKSSDEVKSLKIRHSSELMGIEEKYAKLRQEKLDEEKKLKQQQLQDLQKIIDAADENNIMQQYSKLNQELIANDAHYQQLISQAEAAGLVTAALTEEQARKENEIKAKYAGEEKKLALDTANAKLEIAQQGLTALTSLGDAYFSSQLANVEKGSKAELDLKKKQFAFNKKMQIGGAIMDTAKAITAAIAANPFPSPTLPVSIALASITGAAQIAKIASTKFDGGGGGGGGVNIPTGGDGTTAPSPANFAFLGNQPNQQPPLQAYVVGTQVSSNLEAQQLIQNQSRLGG
jgi:hypothetical protein